MNERRIGIVESVRGMVDTARSSDMRRHYKDMGGVFYIWLLGGSWEQ